MKELKCKNCPYFSGIQCHGHGEYYGECLLIKVQREYIAKMLNRHDIYELIAKGKKYLIEEIRYEDSNCLIFDDRKKN